LTSSSYDADADDLFVRLGWQKLNLQQELKTATMVYKSVNGLAPDYLKSMLLIGVQYLPILLGIVEAN